MATYTKDEIKELFYDDKFKTAYNASVELINEILSKGGIVDSDLWRFTAELYLFACINPLSDSVDDILNCQYYTFIRQTVKYSESTKRYYENCEDMILNFHYWAQRNFVHMIGNLKIDFFQGDMGILDTMTEMLLKLYSQYYVMEDNIAFLCRNPITSEDAKPVVLSDRFDLNDELDSEYIDKKLHTIQEYIYKTYSLTVIKAHLLNGIKLFEQEADEATNIEELFRPKSGIIFVERLAESLDRINEEWIEGKKILLSIKTFILTLTIEFNGKPISIWYNLAERQKRIDDIKKLNEEVLILDPDYEPLEIPELEPYSPPQEPKSSYDNLSNSASSTSSNGCYVATAVYGSYDCPEVWTLRRYRDDVLAKIWHGRLFIYLYYAISPTIVRLFGDTMWFKNMWRGKLDKKVKQLQSDGVENTPYNDKNWRKER